MEFYLTAPDRSRIHLPINPENITCQTGSRIQTFNVIGLGEIDMPRGITPARFSWEGFFPGEFRKDFLFGKSWRDPKEFVGILSLWRAQNTKVRLLVTETSINYDCYIYSFEHSWGGGHGDAQYRIELVQAIDLKIYTESERESPVVLAAATTRPAPSTPKTYTVKSGDSLYAIAKQILGEGGRWNEIYQANVETVGKDPNLIRPGQVLRIPGGAGGGSAYV